MGIRLGFSGVVINIAYGSGLRYSPIGKKKMCLSSCIVESTSFIFIIIYLINIYIITMMMNNIIL